jgi:hypothetical protein
VSFIAVTVEPDCDISDEEAHAACVVVDTQAYEFAKTWGVDYTPVVFFSNDVLMKLEGDELTKFVTDARLLTIQKALDVPGALGYHDDIAGVILSRVMAQGPDTWITLSHEVLEEIGDPTCDVFAPLGDGREQALEACDRVEGDNYVVDGVPLSNYLLPSAFQPDSEGPWDRLKVLTKWDGMSGGGYMIVRDRDGNVTDVFAETNHAQAKVATKLARAGSRTARRVAAEVPPAEKPAAPVPEKATKRVRRARA